MLDLAGRARSAGLWRGRRGDRDPARCGSRGPSRATSGTSSTPASPPRFGWLQLGLRADDAEIAYLNGVEVARLGLPAKKRVSPESPGSKKAEAVAEPASSHHMIDPNTLSAGANVVAVELHRDPADGSEFVFDADLVGLRGSGLTACRATRAGATGTPAPTRPATGRKPDFDDSAWASGPAPLGCGKTTRLATPLRSPADRPGAARHDLLQDRVHAVPTPARSASCCSAPGATPERSST